MSNTNYNILITGANGQLGSALKKCTINKPSNANFLFTDLAELDITKPTQLNDYCTSNKVQFIVNCAAYTAVDKAESDKETAYLLNTKAVENLVSAAQNSGAYFIHISTDYVFDGKSYKPYTEDDPVNPQSVYGLSKLQGEQKALHYKQSMIIRTAWLYSEFGVNFAKTMLRLGKEKSELNVVFDQVGTPTNANDLAAAIVQIIDNVYDEPKKFCQGVYHYSNEGVCSWYDFATEIMHLAKLPCKLRPIEGVEYPTPAPRPHYSVLNKRKIKSKYKIDIPHWQTSLASCINILQNN
ncbi:MAG: dTDP-4-dehydrorhamnose reductase [Bacteroidales bacterium]